MSRQICFPAQVYLRNTAPRLIFGLTLLAGAAWSQNRVLTQASSSTVGGFTGPKWSFCDSGENVEPSKWLTFGQQACWYATDLTAPGRFVEAGVSSAIGQWHNDNYGKGQDGTDYAHRFGVYYARHTARDAAELIAGYLNHEDSRPHVSGETGAWRRTKAALISVLIAKTDTGERPALTPLAGAFGSAFVGSALSRQHGITGGTILKEASFGYSGSFGTALYQEFKPDLSSLVRRALHRHTD